MRAQTTDALSPQQPQEHEEQRESYKHELSNWEKLLKHSSPFSPFDFGVSEKGL